MNPEVGQQNNMVYASSAPGASGVLDAPKKSRKPVALIILGVIGVLAMVAIGVLVFLLKGGDIDWDLGYGDIVNTEFKYTFTDTLGNEITAEVK